MGDWRFEIDIPQRQTSPGQSIRLKINILPGGTMYPPLHTPGPLSSKLYAYPRQQGGSESKKKSLVTQNRPQLNRDVPAINQGMCTRGLDVVTLGELRCKSSYMPLREA